MYIVQSCGNNDVPCTYKLTFKVREKKEILIEVMYQEAIKTVLELYFFSFTYKGQGWIFPLSLYGGNRCNYCS